MNAAERQNEIVDLVRSRGFVSIDSLAERYAVTPQTIRRDINLLCDRGLLRRFHGGAGMPAAPSELANLAYQARQVLNLEAKGRIAALVARHIPNGASLFIGIGTTPEQVARALLRHQGLSVMTNNLNAAMVLCASDTCTVTVAGGRLRNLDRDVIGEPAAEFFGAWKVDFSVFGVGGIDEDGTLLDFDAGEVRARQAMAANARRTLLVADATKFGRNAMARGGQFRDASAFFTDRPVPDAYRAMVVSSSVPVHVAGSGPGGGNGGTP